MSVGGSGYLWVGEDLAEKYVGMCGCEFWHVVPSHATGSRSGQVCLTFQSDW